MSKLEQRVRRAAESILENESLTAGLDDTTAKALLDWGVACAEAIAHNTAGLVDDQAEAIMSLRLGATRRLMRHVRRWVVNGLEIDSEASAELLAEILEQAAIAYQDFVPPHDNQRDLLLDQWPDLAVDPPYMIDRLRTLIEEGAGDDFTTNPGGRDDQEIQEI